jgi:predicted metal-binding protein
VSKAETTIYICTACRGKENADERPGEALLTALQEVLAGKAESSVRVEAAECLAVCKRPGTVALAGAGKWAYVIGDVEQGDIGDVIAAAESHAASENGLVPWKERPTFFKKGVVSRLPPLAASAPKD